MSKIKQAKELAVYVIHFNGMPLHEVKGTWNEWRPPKKIYYTESAAKIGIKYVPNSIRDLCEIVKYTPEK